MAAPVVRFSFEADAVPQLEVEQTPDAIIVVAIAGSMFAEEFLHGGSFKKTAIHTAWFEQQAFYVVELRTRQPATPRRRKT
jgi:hypothetical protein